MIATGLGNGMDTIEGLRSALENPESKVFSTIDLCSNKSHKFMSYFYNGDAVFYLPEFPYSGEVETSNMLMSLDLWQHFENIGNASPFRSVTVVTPNDRLISKSDKLNEFYLNKLAQHGATIVYGKKLTAVNDRNYFFL